MEKVIVSVDGSEASRAAVQWCVEHLAPGTTVVAVCGIGGFGELVISVPPLEGLAEETTIEECLNGPWCEPLRRAGLRCRPRLVHLRQVPALLEVVERERPDALVVGREAHHGIDSLFGWGALNQVVHRASCPLVLVPSTTDTAKRADRRVRVHAVAADGPMGSRPAQGRRPVVQTAARRRRRHATLTPAIVEPTPERGRPRPY